MLFSDNVNIFFVTVCLGMGLLFDSLTLKYFLNCSVETDFILLVWIFFSWYGNELAGFALARLKLSKKYSFLTVFASKSKIVLLKKSS